MLSLSIIFACFYACCLEFFPLYPLLFKSRRPNPGNRLPLRRLLRLQSVTQNASRRGRLHDLWRAVIKPNFPRELYPFIYCLTILGVFYAATVGFYRCTFFRILFCTFYEAFIREFSRFTLLKILTCTCNT